ncbi:MAG: putative membrane protein YgcG [Bacillariaceae sp.]|jgi:uncharacterized membrane protein YgcG
MNATTSIMLRKASKKALSLTEIVGNNKSRILRATYATWGRRKFTSSSLRDQEFLSYQQANNFSTTTAKIPIAYPLPAVAYDYIDDDDDNDEHDDGYKEDDHHSSSSQNSFTTKEDTTCTSQNSQFDGVNNCASKGEVYYGVSRRNFDITSAVEEKNHIISSSSSFSTLSSNCNSKFNPIYNTSLSSSSNVGGGDNTTPYPPPPSAEQRQQEQQGGITHLGSNPVTYRNGGGGSGGGGGGSGRHRCPKCGTTVTFKCDFEDNTFYW